MMKKPITFAQFILFFCVLQFISSCTNNKSLPPELLSRGGLCVMIGGTEDYTLAETLLGSGPWIIHWLDSRLTEVEEARRYFQQRQFYGQIVVEHWDKSHLPYADNLVNLLIVPDKEQILNKDEVLRVLAPEGKAYISGRSGFVITEKQRPQEMGEWTHPWQGADGNLASSEKSLKVPNTFQWLAGPTFPMAQRKNSTGAILSAGGRVFYITQNVPENLNGGDQNFLLARDAFNGVVLWSRPWEGPLSAGHADGYHEAVVVTDKRIYGAREHEVAVFDAADGKVLNILKMDATPDKLLLTDGILVAQAPNGLTGFNAITGKQLWYVEADHPWGTLTRDGRVFYIEGTREQDGRWKHVLEAVKLKSGKALWQQQMESEYSNRNTAVLRLHFSGNGFVCLVERKNLRILSSEDGSELWRRVSETEARGEGGMDSRQVGHFFINGMLWMRADRARGGREVPETWLALDPLTGKEIREVIATGSQGVISNVNKVSCQPLTATANYVLDSRLATIWDLETGQREGFKFARGGCQVGMIPANGLGYISPNACGCLEEQLRANMAVVHSEDEGLHSFIPASLEQGPAYGMKLSLEVMEELPVWPMYRRDSRRGAYIPVDIPHNLTERWKTTLELQPNSFDKEWQLNFGRALTPPVIADGLVVLAQPQTHQVIAIDRTTGKERWRYTAGGRVTVPPALYRGLAIFGSHDGYVYALRSADGALVWRRRVAPSDRRIMAYGQLESTWPVAGGVLVQGGLALVAAGRTADASGGLILQAIDPASGEVKWMQRIEEARYGTYDPLVSDGRYAYLLNMRIDPQSGDMSEVTGFQYGQSDRGGAEVHFPEGVRYLRGGKAGLLETSWTQIDLGVRKAISTWTWGEIEGEMMSFTDKTAYTFQIDAGGLDNRGRQIMWSAPVCNGGGLIEARVAGAGSPRWSYRLPAPAQVEAMLTTPGTLFISGPNNRMQPAGNGFLTVISNEKGKELSRLNLPAAPVHDGLAAAEGDIFAVLKDGSVICLGGDE